MVSEGAVLEDLRGEIDMLTEEHIGRREALWMPSEIVFPPERTHDERIAELREAAARVPPALRVVYALHLITEEGLPSYFELLAECLGLSGMFGRWIYRWTAEEDRHGTLLTILAGVSGLIPRQGELERIQFGYVGTGFRPAWWEGNPYHLLAYSALQEAATKIAHGNLSIALKRAGATPFVQPLALVAAEENYHGRFYAAVVGHVLARDPERMFAALRQEIEHFAMPGRTMPQYRTLAEVAARARILTPGMLARIVADLLQIWRTDEVASTPAARAECAAIEAWMVRMHRSDAAVQERSLRPRTFLFPFLTEPVVL